MANSNILNEIIRIENDKEKIGDKLSGFLKKTSSTDTTLTNLVTAASGKTGSEKYTLDNLTTVIEGIPNNGHVSKSLGYNESYTIPQGYHDGTGTVTSGDIKAGTITSGSATISSVTYTYNTEDDNFAVTGKSIIGAPTVGTAGYISNTVGTKNTNTANLSTSIAKIVGETSTSVPEGKTPTPTPVITRSAITNTTTLFDGASGAATTTTPTSGVYVKVSTAADKTTLTSTPNVTSTGYGTSSKHGIAGTTTTVGAEASAATYIPIKTSCGATTTGTSSGIAKTSLNCGDKTIIGAGYVTSAITITANSLASQTNGNATAATIYKNKTAWVNGKQITGTMPDAVLTNAATTDVTYTEITRDDVIIPSDGALYINAGYTGNVKITLAQLVPNVANIPASSASPYIISGKTAYDKDGKLITGSIKNNAGSDLTTASNLTIDGLVSASDKGNPGAVSISGFYAEGSKVSLTSSIYNRLVKI